MDRTPLPEPYETWFLRLVEILIVLFILIVIAGLLVTRARAVPLVA